MGNTEHHRRDRLEDQDRRLASILYRAADPLAAMRREFDAVHGVGQFDRTRHSMRVAVNLLRSVR